MTKRDKIGLSIIVAFLLTMMGLLAWMLWGSPRTGRDFSDSAIVRQRIINLRKK